MNYIGDNLKYVINTFFDGSRQDFCEKYNCSEVQLSRYINNNQSPKFEWLYQISKDYGFSLNDMFDSDFNKGFRNRPSINNLERQGNNKQLLEALHEENLYFERVNEDMRKRIISIQETLDTVLRATSKTLLDNADYSMKFDKLVSKIDILIQNQQE